MEDKHRGGSTLLRLSPPPAPAVKGHVAARNQGKLICRSSARVRKWRQGRYTKETTPPPKQTVLRPRSSPHRSFSGSVYSHEEK